MSTDSITNSGKVANVDAAPEISNSKADKKQARSEIKAGPAAIIKFLQGCTRFQADAIRVIVSNIDEDGTSREMSSDDIEAINAYLNHGATAVTVKNESDMARHRGMQLQSILQLLMDFFSKKAYCTAVVVLAGITNNATYLKAALNELQKKV
jgi:hypothetical protein